MRDMHRMRDKIELQLDNRQVVSFVIGSVVVLGVVFVLGVLVGKQLAGAPAPLASAKPADPLAALDAQELSHQEAVKPATAPKASADAEPMTGTGELHTTKGTVAVADAVPEVAAPSKVEKAEPEPKVAAAEAKAPVAAVAGDKAEKKPEVAAVPEKPLTYADELTKPKSDPLLEPLKPAHAEKAVAAPREEKVAEKKADAPKEKEHRKEALGAAFEKVTPPAEHKSTAKKSSGDAYALQVSSLPDKGEADRVASKLATKGYSAFVAEADVPGKGRFYRVKVGSYSTRDEADEALKSFKKKTAMSAIVTAR